MVQGKFVGIDKFQVLDGQIVYSLVNRFGKTIKPIEYCTLTEGMNNSVYMKSE